MGKLDGKVAFITGAARGQGRSHAELLAQEGADLILLDICADYRTTVYPMATEEDLVQTAESIRAQGTKVEYFVADVRDADALRKGLDAGVEALGRLDIVCANAGISTAQSWDEVTEEVWNDVIDTDLTGVWNTLKASIPHLLATDGGSIIVTASTASKKPPPYFAPYAAAKAGVVGLAKSLANELASSNVRVNTVHPTGVNSPMGTGMMDNVGELLDRDRRLAALFMNAQLVDLVEPIDVSRAVLFLASDDARHVTGMEFYIDAGAAVR
jgi:SDR family mycofactocin-dependent oxidoreductase